jgi:hypothetical protein
MEVLVKSVLDGGKRGLPIKLAADKVLFLLKAKTFPGLRILEDIPEAFPLNNSGDNLKIPTKFR